MIIDDKEEYWVIIERAEDKNGVLYCPDNEGEYMRHWGKWLIFGSVSYLSDLAKQLDNYINIGEIDSAKYNREPNLGKTDCVMCVYCDDRDKERVHSILRKLGVSFKIWKYDSQTLTDWSPSGKLYNTR